MDGRDAANYLRILKEMDNSDKILAFFAKKKKHGCRKRFSSVRSLQQMTVYSTNASSGVQEDEGVMNNTAMLNSEALKNVQQKQEGWIELDEDKKQVIQTSGKTLTNLDELIPEEDEEDGEIDQDGINAFKWTVSSSKKKIKDPTVETEPPKTWSELQERKRQQKSIQLDSERMFPSLGGSASDASRAPAKPAQVVTSNVWARFRTEESDSEDESSPKAEATTPAAAAPESDKNLSRFAGLKKKKKKPIS